MSYDQLRHLADSYGLILMTLVFVGFIGWTYRRGAGAVHERARTMIFEEDSRDA